MILVRVPSVTVDSFWAYYDSDDVVIRVKGKGFSPYIWGDAECAFHCCEHCGWGSHYVTTEKFVEEIVAVNARIFEREATKNIPIRKNDGERFYHLGQDITHDLPMHIC